MKKIKCIFLLFLIIMMTFSFTINSYAGDIKVTEENLKVSFEKIVKTEDNKNAKIIIENNVITIESDDEVYKLDYDITGKPTFTCVANVKNGMSYEEYKNETDKLFATTMLAYMAIADIQGTDSETAMQYFLICGYGGYYSKLSSEANKYMLVFDLQGSARVTSDTSEVIYESEFDKHVMEYVNSIYSNKVEIEDDEKTFKLLVEQKEKTNDSCKIISTITIDTDKDFSKVNEAIEKFKDSLDIFKDITENTADYVVRLKVGQKCKMEYSEKCTSYSSYGKNIKFQNDGYEIIGIEEGTTKGKIYFGEDREVTYYAIVEKNTNNEKLDDINLKIIAPSQNTTGNSNNNDSINNNSNNTISSDVSISINTQMTEEEIKQAISETLANEERNRYKKVLELLGNGKVSHANAKTVIDESSTTMPRTGIETNPLLIVSYICFASAAVGIVILLITSKKRK